jgi:hypothetical protein
VGDVALKYKLFTDIDDLLPNECTIHRAADASGKRWWLLWFNVARESDGVLQHIAVPINPGGEYNANGPGGKTWGFQRTLPGVWQVSPSVNVTESQVLHPGEHPTERTLWHQTPSVIDVPETGEAWQPA